MQVLSLVTRKGGAGKSVLALTLAVAAERAGERVAIIDMDPQGTTASWYKSRPSQRPVLVEHVPPGRLHDILAVLSSSDFTLAVIDTPGGAGAEGEAVGVSHLCLVPVRPCEADVRATFPTLQALAAAGRPYAIVVNQAPARSAAGPYRPVWDDGPVLPLAIAARVDHQHAYARGQSVQELAPQGKAAEEVGQLWHMIAQRLGTTSPAPDPGSTGEPRGEVVWGPQAVAAARPLSARARGVRCACAVGPRPHP